MSGATSTEPRGRLSGGPDFFAIAERDSRLRERERRTDWLYGLLASLIVAGALAAAVAAGLGLSRLLTWWLSL